MATQTLISEADFLAMNFESPEPDYVDGEMVARSISNIPHSRIQFAISHLSGLEAERLQLYPCTELRMRVAPGRYIARRMSRSAQTKRPRASCQQRRR